MDILVHPTDALPAVYFRPGNDGRDRQLESYPRRMVYDGREYTFAEAGMRYLIRRGQQLVKLFDVSDGRMDYRLRQDSDNHWTLVTMKAHA